MPNKLIFPGGRTYIEVGDEPVFVPLASAGTGSASGIDQANGVTLRIGDPFRFARFRHDVVSRTHWNPSGLGVTNETIVIRPVLDGQVQIRSKIVIKLAQHPAWITQFRRMLGDFMYGLFREPKFGYMDTNFGSDESHTVLRNGGGLARIERVEGTHAIISHQDFDSTPNPTINAWNRPDIVAVQGLVGHTTVRDYWQRHPKHKHLEWPFVSRYETAVPLNTLEFFPELPHAATLHGQPVLIEAYGFTGPRVFGLVDDAWKLLEEMLIVDHIPGWPRAGSEADRRVYVDPWIGTWPQAWSWQTRGLTT